MANNKNKSGRPVSNQLVQEIMRDRKCSRTWAYELYRRERRRKLDEQKHSGFGPWMFHCDDV